MVKTIPERAIARSMGSIQIYILLLLGLFCLLGAWLLQLNPFAYPLGLLLFGIGMLVAAAFNPYRLLISGIMITLIGLAIFFAFKPLIPYSGGLLILAIGLGLLALAVMTRRGYVGPGAFTPAVIVIIVGLVEYSPASHFLPSTFVATVLSLWFPGVGLLLLALIYFLLDRSRQRVVVEKAVQ